MEIIVASYADRLTNKTGRGFRALIESNFVVQLSRGKLANLRKSTETETETQYGGGCYLTSGGGTLTGRGGAYIIIDDPLKASEAVSQVALRNVIDWFTTTVYSRQNRPQETRMIVSMQRLHADDLAGFLIEAGWPSFVMPAIAIEDEVFDLGGGRKHRRRKGDLLQPGWNTMKDYENARNTSGSYIFSAQYQQDPMPAQGIMVDRDWLKTYKKQPERERFRNVYVACDPSGKAGSHNDFTAIVVFGTIGPEVYMLHVDRGHWTCLQIKQKLLALFAQWKPTRILLETTGQGEAVRQELLRERRYDILARQPKMDKVTRLSTVITRFENGYFLLPESASWLADFMSELLNFSDNCRYDDQVDALVMGLEDFQDREARENRTRNIVIPEWNTRREYPYLSDHFSNRGYGY